VLKKGLREKVRVGEMPEERADEVYVCVKKIGIRYTVHGVR
jgi:hypothetical protein